MIRVADVCFESRVAGQGGAFTYEDLVGARPGQAFLVPLGSRNELGYVIQTREVDAEALGFEARRLRRLGPRVFGVDLPESVLELVRFVSDVYLCPLPVALGLATPPGVRSRLETRWRLTDATEPSALPLSPPQEEALRVLRESGGELIDTKERPLGDSARRALRHLVTRGYVVAEVQVRLPSERHRLTGLFRLCSDQGKIERFLMKSGKRKPAQAATLLGLADSGHAGLSPQEIKSLTGATDQTMRALLTAGLLEEVRPNLGSLSRPPELNEHQQAAVAAVLPSIEHRQPDQFLLFGITGSGKTEVYLRLTAETLRLGRNVLYLVPEIALTAQVIGQLRGRFGSNVAILHSNLGPHERLESWMEVQTGSASIILGARSALFAPIQNLGLIVMDEEHEASYKQETAPRYHARQVATRLGELHRAAVVLGSATPSIETYYDASKGRLKLLSLPERAASAQLPEVRVEDLAQGYRAGHPAMFTDALHDGIAAALDDNKQVILFLNRRAFSPFALCRECGHSFPCPSCAVSLAVHRRIGRLKCHYCNFSCPIPQSCPGCGGHRVAAIGVGVERVEEALRESFPKATVARLDRDAAARKGYVEEVLARFRSGEIEILVGTQMVAKGLDFPNVTLVGVVLADVSLNLPDFRASERSFQLLSQVSGRAGRGKSPGTVVIQTFCPEHIAVKFAQQHDYLRFHEAIIDERRAAGYPPFRRLVNLLFTSESRPHLETVVRSAAAQVQGKLPEGAQMLGPADCAIERLGGRWRKQILLKLDPGSDVSFLSDALNAPDLRGVQLTIDVDPYAMH